MLLLLLVALSAAALSAAAGGTGSEIFVYGDDPAVQEVYSGTPWTYDGAGDDWAGVDGAGKPWVCTTGKAQSPINIVTSAEATAALPNEHRVQYDLGAVASNGSNVRLANNGHSVQVSWSGLAVPPKVTITVQDGQPVASAVQLGSGDKLQQVVAVPQQFHFHAHSEHLLQGHLYPMEAHLVSVVSQAVLPACPKQGCVVVTGVLFELSDDLTTGSDWLEPLFAAMPLNEGGTAYLGAGASLDLQQLLPANQSYVSYAGSLTTPPCTEGVLWVAMLNTQKMSLQQWRRFMTAVGDYNCTVVEAGSAPAGNSTAAGSKGGRRLLHNQPLHQQSLRGLQHGIPGRGLQQAAVADTQYSCKKLGAGHNYRMPQPLNGRVLRLWRDSTNKKGYLPEDAASAASAGAVAGIVVGTTLGAGLTALIGWVAFREYQKRRLKRFYKYGVSSGDMLSVQREVETQWLTTKSSNAGSGPL